MSKPLTYKPTNDLLFKKLMTTVGKEQIIEGFVHDVTDITLTSVKPDNPYQLQNYKKFVAKQKDPLYNTIVDVAATTAEGIDIIIEMQVYPHEGFFERILNYWAAAFTKNHTPDHRGYKPVISIAVTNFQVFNEHDEVCVPLGLVHLEKFVEVYNKSHQPFERIYLVNLQGKDSRNTIINQWKKFFTQGIIDETEAPMYLKEAYELLQNVNLSTEEREMADTMTKQEEIYYSQLAYAKKVGIEEGFAEGREQGREKGRAEGLAEGLAEGRAEGLAEGRAEGELKGRKETIQALMNNLHLSAGQIADALHLSIQEVEKILDDK